MVGHGRSADTTGPLSLVVPSAPRSIGLVRRFAVEACDRLGWGCSADTVSLLVSEVATNAVLYSPGDEVDVHVLLRDGRLRVEVDDTSPQPPTVRGAGSGDEGGRGLALLAMLAASWGVRARAGGKTVWFEIAD